MAVEVAVEVAVAAMGEAQGGRKVVIGARHKKESAYTLVNNQMEA